MTNISKLHRTILSGSTALSAVAMLGGALTASAFVAAPAFAQDYTRGNLTGTVLDQSGNPISGATVTVRSNEQGFSNTATTDNNGVFRVTALPTGSYTVTVTSNGAVVVNDPNASVFAGQSNTYRYTAGEQAAADSGSEIVVTGSRVRVDDFAATQTGATLNVAELAETIPVQRDQTSLILLAPGTTGGDTGFGDFASISGATVAENAYYVNGLNITDFRNFLGGARVPFEFYRTLDVKTGGYQAEYGRAMGGVTSAVVKAGSNKFEAGAVITYSPDSLQSDSPDTYAARNGTDYTEELDANLYLSGPIIKDRLFFYALYSPQYFKQSDDSITSRERVTTTSSSPFFGGKVDFVITDGHRLEGMYFRDKQTQKTRYQAFDPATDEIGAATGAVINKVGGDNFIGTYTGQFTDWLTLSAAYGEYNNVGTQVASPDVAYATSIINSPTGTVRKVLGSVASRINDVDQRKIYRADADIYANLLGEHHIRAGFDLEKLSAEEGTYRNAGGYDYVFQNAYVQRTFYANVGFFESKQRAFYLQDSWTLLDNRLNLQLGVRNDRFQNYSVTGEKYYDSGDQWAPRIGASFDLFGDQRTRLNAFWGRYYLPIATNTNIRLAGQELFYRQRFNYPAGGNADANGDGVPDNLVFDDNGDVVNLGTNRGGNPCPDAGPNAGELCWSILSDGVPGPTDTLVSSTLAPSYTDEIILGISHRVSDWTFSLDYVNRRLGETLEDVAIDAAVLAYCDREGVAGCDDVFTGFHQYVLANPGSDMTVRLDGDCDIAGQCDVVTLLAEDLGYKKAVRKYDAVQFKVDKAFNGLWGFNASYTYTKLRGNYEGAVKSENNQTDAGLTQDFDQPGFQDGFYGRLANGREHVFKAYGHVQPAEWVDLGMNVVVESPRYFSCFGNYFDEDNFAAAYGSASFYCTQPDVGGEPVANSGGGTSYLVDRGTGFKSDWNKRIDLGLAFKLGNINSSLGDTQFRVDVFNVFNWKSKLDFNEYGDVANFVYAPNPRYGEVTGYQAPRSVRFTLSTRFGAN